MAYFSQEGSLHGWNGPEGYIPASPITDVVCDDCATDVVPFEWVGLYENPEHHKRQCDPWKWAPVYGGKCDKCSRRC